MALGESLGQVTKADVSLVVLVGVITMTTSTYLILGADKIYDLLGDYLSFFERKKIKERSSNIHS